MVSQLAVVTCTCMFIVDGGAELHTGFLPRGGKLHAQYTTHEGLGMRLLKKNHFFYYLHVHVCVLLC